MKLIVSDASSLILLSKASVLEKACSRHDIVIPPSVEQEACSPYLIKKHADASVIHELIERGDIKIEELKEKRGEIPVRLGTGETDAIFLFQQLDADLLLTDDGKAVKACRILRIPFVISPSIVLDLHESSCLTTEEAVHSIEQLRISGRYSPDIIAEILLKIRIGKRDV